MADKAKANGTAFQSRDEATKSFQQKYEKQYTSKYDSEPAARPAHIPTTYQTHTIIYDRGYHGYGYYSLGRWYPYDPLLDAVMLSSLMTRHDYYAYPSGHTQVVYRDGSGFGTVLLVVLGIIVVLVIVGVIVSRD